MLEAEWSQAHVDCLLSLLTEPVNTSSQFILGSIVKRLRNRKRIKKKGKHLTRRIIDYCSAPDNVSDECSTASYLQVQSPPFWPVPGSLMGSYMVYAVDHSQVPSQNKVRQLTAWSASHMIGAFSVLILILHFFLPVKFLIGTSLDSSNSLCWIYALWGYVA